MGSSAPVETFISSVDSPPSNTYPLKRGPSGERICQKCESSQNLFRVNKNKGRTLISSLCISCKPRNRGSKKNKPIAKPVSLQSSIRRRSKKFGHSITYSTDEIRNFLSLPCEYCGRASSGLDRKDSSMSYERENIVPCCTRCNMIKNSMPYEAWTALVPAVRDANEKGLFGSWKDNGSFDPK